MTTLSELRISLLTARKTRLGPSGEQLADNWKAVGEAFGIPGGTANRIAMTDYEPKRTDIRLKLGLPALILTRACPVHGVVHVTKRCPKLIPTAKDLFSLPVKTLRWMLDNRKEMK